MVFVELDTVPMSNSEVYPKKVYARPYRPADPQGSVS